MTNLFARKFCCIYLSRMLLICAAFSLLPSSALAFESPRFQGDVYDEAGLLSATDQKVLQSRITTLRENAGIWAAIYVAKSLQHGSIEEAAVEIFQKWSLGQAGKDNGVLVLIAPNERQVRIEVGYGLEGKLTDAISSRIVHDIYQPAFREKRYVEGISQGFEAMALAVNGMPFPNKPLLPSQSSEADFDWSHFPRYFALTFALNLTPTLLFFLALLYGRSKKRQAPGTLWEELKLPIAVSPFFGVFFGIFVALFTTLTRGSPFPALILFFVNSLFASFYLIPMWIKMRTLISASGYRRSLAFERLVRIRARSKETRMIFGVLFEPKKVIKSEGGTRRNPSNSNGTRSNESISSGSSSWNSSSSSSGGGRSGGGGASGSW